MADSIVSLQASKERTQRRDAWTPESEAQLCAFAAEGKYTQDIAKALGRSQQAVAHRANKLGVPLRSAPRRLLQKRAG